MGDFSAILPNDIICNNIWAQICKTTPREDRMVLFLLLCLTSKARKDLVDGNQQWAHARFYFLELRF
jgi:hypothetical protein